MAMKVACGNGFPLNIPSEIPTGGGGGGTGDYSDLTNKPQINDVTLSGNKSLSDIGAAAAADVSDIQDLIPSDASSSNKLATANDLPGLATTSAPGLVQPDGTTVTINNGVISAVGGGGGGIIINTTETVVGSYCGNTLYAKVFTSNQMPNTSEQIIGTLPTGSLVVYMLGVAYNIQAPALSRPLPLAGGGTNDVRIDYNDGVRIWTFSDWSAYRAEVTVFYTKSS